MLPTLVILSTHFGRNFSGGSTASCEIFERLQQRFRKTVIVGTRLGEHRFNNLEFYPYRGSTEAAGILKSFDPAKCIFYGDFYNASIFARHRIPFYFTYHDNWPELAALSLRFRLQGVYYWQAYRRIFRQARHVFTVSQRKLDLVRQYSDNASLVRNGVTQQPQSSPGGPGAALPRQQVLMVGNIDKRKYAMAVELFDRITSDPGFTIDIYGHCNDRRLAQALRRYPFVSIKGYQEHIPYHRYRLLLHTSLMENLSIVWCEAIMHQTPVLTFDVGAAGEVVTAGFGERIEAYNLQQMQQRLLVLGGPNQPARQQHNNLSEQNQQQNLRRFAAQFNWDSAAHAYSQVLFAS